MKKIVYTPGGVLENVIALVGYENLCMMLYDDETLVSDISEFVGKTLYEDYAGRIAVLGGIDLNFVINATEEEISARAKAMLDRSASRGGYALGSGNSIPDYVPDENYLALIRPALEG